MNPFHEPNPLIPAFSPTGGEGARRAVEGDSQWLMAPIRVQIFEDLSAPEPLCGASICDRRSHQAFGGAHRDAATRFTGAKLVIMPGHSLPLSRFVFAFIWLIL